jgi:hypothetical protein
VQLEQKVQLVPVEPKVQLVPKVAVEPKVVLVQLDHKVV